MKRVLTYIFILFWAGIMFAQNNSYIVLLNPNDTIPENTIAGEQGLHIVFPCNKTYFDKKQESWIRLNEDLDSLLTDSLFSIEAIHMYGAASPEGPYNNNVYLSINRAKRVIDNLQANFPDFDFSAISSFNVPEDYERLIYVTKEDSLYSDISKYIGKDDFETKKNLQKDKKMWNDLLKRYYPGLRAVNIIIYVKKKFVKKIIIVPELPKASFKFDYIIPEPTIKPIIRTYCSRLPMIRLKTNLVYDALIVPNASLEFLPKTGHFTGEARFLWSGWRNDSRYKTWIIHAYEAGFRYYLKKDKHTGWFFNGLAGIGVYDIELSKNKGFLSKKYFYNNKLELGIGYVWNLGKNWTIEATCGFGMIHSKYDRYHGAEDWATPGEFYYDWHLQPEDYSRYNRKLKWIGPTNIGISLSYDIIHYKKKCVNF